MNIIKEEVGDLKDIFRRIKRRDLKGNTGQAIKNSSYQFVQGLVTKIGSLLFTIIMARMLMPELMGLYSLALVTIVMFVSISDLGIYPAVITFGSKMLGKNDPAKAKGYVKKLFKWKLILVSIFSLILLASSYFMANIYYNKPIFYALLVGVLYLPAITILVFLEYIFRATNNFREPLIKEIFFQAMRFIFIPLVIFFLLRSNLSSDIIISIVLLTITMCYLFSIILLAALSKNKLKFLSVREKKLKKPEIAELKKFIIPLSVLSLSGVFFGYVDTLMLGHYISSSFIAYYGAAFALIGSASTIISFSAMSLMPIFSRISGTSLEKMFAKTRNLTLLISVAAGAFTYSISWWIIKLAYGEAYLSAVPILKYLSILVAILPIMALYNSYFISQKKTKTIAWLIIMATTLNITFNFIGINYGLSHYGEMGGVFGAVGATILSRFAHLTGLVLWRK